MSSRTSSQASLIGNPRPLKRRKKGLKMAMNWSPSSKAPIPCDTDAFLYCPSNQDMKEFDENHKLKMATIVPPNIPPYTYFVQILDVREKQICNEFSSLNNSPIKQESLALDGDDKYEYYVHFYAFDRRLDDWFPGNSFIYNLSDEMKEYISIRDKYYRSSNYNDECEFKEEQLRTHFENTKIKNFTHIIIGKYMVKAWYFSPIPIEYRTSPILHFCDFCLSFFGEKCEYEYHMSICDITHPPGTEIYRSKEENITISVFEVDGAKEEIYCQNVSYLAKFFLDHKTLEYDTTSFFFYIVTEVSENGCHFLCYFSKEKNPEKNFNLSCIMAIPCHQRKGLGHFMISLSYGLSKIEKKYGTPETPLSDLGLISYRKFWASELLKIVQKKYYNNKMKELSLQTLADETSFQIEDIWFTLSDLNVLKKCNDQYVFAISKKVFEKFIRPPKIVPNRKDQYINIVQQDKIHWVPHYFKTVENH